MTTGQKNDKGNRGNASQFFVAGELCRRGYVAVTTTGNCPNTDILCSNLSGTKFVHIQVKTFRPNDKTCSVGQKAEKEYGDNFFWVLGGIPEPGQTDDFVYYVIPSADEAKNIRASHIIWEKTPGKNDKPHSLETKFRAVIMPPGKCLNGWEISQYKNRWDLIEEKLNE